MSDLKQKRQVVNGWDYRYVRVQVKGNTWSVMFVTGRTEYMSVRKVTNNPFGTCGKQFKDLDHALANYKDPQMHVALIQARDISNKLPITAL